MNYPDLAADAALNTVVSTRALRIGIDGEALRQPLTGVGRYVFHIGRALETLLPNARFFVYARGPESGLALPSERWQARVEPNPRWRRLPSMAWVKWRSGRLIREDSLDAYWAGRTLLPPLPGSVRSLSTVHDLNCWVVPETMPFKHRWAHRFWFSTDVRRANHVLENSRGTAARLRDLVGVQAEAVAYPGIDAGFARHASGPALPDELPSELQGRGLRPPYLVAVATWEPRKNLARLLQAFAALKRGGHLPEHQLALVGVSGWGSQQDLQRLLDEGRGHGVVCTGYLPDPLMPALYRHAEALVFPSIYEGFGMPVIEALACGTRVVIADVPELREAARGEGTIVAPTVEGIRDGIVQALSGPRPAACDHAAVFSWAAAAHRMAPLLSA